MAAQIKPKLLGILGGTFDPIHKGHVLPALEAAKTIGIDKIALLPLNVAVHRPQPLASALHRLAMCNLVAAKYPIFYVDDSEIKRGGNSYTVDSLEIMREKMPQQAICWMMGLDSFYSFNSWNGWQRILELANLIVIERPDISEQAKCEQNLHNQSLPQELQAYIKKNLYHKNGSYALFGRIVMVSVKPRHVSATETRLKLATGAQCTGELTKNVREYIAKHQLYKKYE